MAEKIQTKKTHKEWRREVKKLRRKKIRRKLAEERRKKEEEEELARLKDPNYLAWLKEQEELEKVQIEQEEKERQEQEELWLRRELIAEKQFREQRRKREATAAIKEAERLRIQNEFEELQQKEQKRREERKKREEQAQKAYELMLQKIDEYIEFGGTIPPELTADVQSNPSKETCPFFSRTNACRYGMQCCRNHIRPRLSKILFFANFFTHIKLEQCRDTEYGCDINLECTDRELYDDYGEFFNDVVDELKTYGQIENFRACMNSQPHLRGNVFVEYTTERDALRAYMKMQGRYYASRRINVEFSSITSWKSAVCGLSYARKCPKGKDCNFLHLFRNPGNLYNTPLQKKDDSVVKSSQREAKTPSEPSWNEGGNRNSRNWRWSESPEPRQCRQTDESKEHRSPKSKRKTSRSHSNRSRSGDRYKRSRSSSKTKHSSKKKHREESSNSQRREKHRRRSNTPALSKENDKGKEHHRKRKRKHKSKVSSSSNDRRKCKDRSAKS